MKLVKATQWRVVPYPRYRIEIDLFLDGCYGHFGDNEDYEGKHPYRVYEIADGEKVPLNAHYEAYWKNGQLAQRRYSHAAIFLTGSLCAGSAFSHHSFATHFGFENIVEVSGALSSVEIRSPHSFLGVAVQQADGSTVIWDVEAHSTALLRRAGITPETLLVGDPITVRGPRSRRPEKNLLFGSELFTSDGRAFETLSSIRQPPSYRIPDQRRGVTGIDRLTGRWLGYVPGQRIADTPLPLNSAGLAARARFDPQDTPAMHCIPPNLPSILFVPYLYDVRLNGDELLLHNEYYAIKRTVKLGSPDPDTSTPEFGQRTARFEDGILIVESSEFPPNRAGLAASLEPNGNGFDVPSSDQKRFTERYTVNDDGGELTVEYTLEDPVYLSEPFASRIVFHRVPEDTPMFDFPCDADIATRSTLNAVPREENF